MIFDTKKTPNPNVQYYVDKDIDIAYEFSKKAYKEFGSFVKSIVLFGATARKNKEHADIDILIVVDDINIYISDEIVQAYRIIVEKMVVDTSPKLHITTLKLTNFWEYARIGDPLAINLLRDGVALLDTGFFEPLQALLLRGKIRPTQESIWAYYARAPMTLNTSRWHITQATLDLYWAVIDAAHATLMVYGEIPPSPEHVADLLEEKLYKKGKLEKKYVNMMRKFYVISKKIVHREISYIEPKEYDILLKEATLFVKRMELFVKKK